MIDTLAELRRRAFAGDAGARVELRTLRDPLADVLDDFDDLRARGLEPPAIGLLHARALAGDPDAPRELERQLADLAERQELARKRVAEEIGRRKEADDRRGRAKASRARRHQLSIDQGAPEAAAVHMHVKEGGSPDWYSRASRRKRPVKIICPRPPDRPPQLRRGAAHDDVDRWIEIALKAGTPVERELAKRCGLLRMGVGVNLAEWKGYDVFTAIALLHVICLSATKTRLRRGCEAVVAGVYHAELAWRCAVRGRGGQPLTKETVSRYVSLFRGTAGDCRGTRVCSSCAKQSKRNCGELIEGAARPGLFSDLLEIHQPPGGLPGVPSSLHTFVDGTSDSYGINLYWFYDVPRQKRAPGFWRLDRAGGLAFDAGNPKAPDLHSLATSGLGELVGKVSQAPPATGSGALGAPPGRSTRPPGGGPER